MDILPTILNAARITRDPSVPLDGHSLLGAYSRRYQYSEYWYDVDANTHLPSWAEIRTVATTFPYEGHTLVLHRWYGLNPLVVGPISAEELY